jgi:hypothetical protein
VKPSTGVISYRYSKKIQNATKKCLLNSFAKLLKRLQTLLIQIQSRVSRKKIKAKA